MQIHWPMEREQTTFTELIDLSSSGNNQNSHAYKSNISCSFISMFCMNVWTLKRTQWGSTGLWYCTIYKKYKFFCFIKILKYIWLILKKWIIRWSYVFLPFFWSPLGVQSIPFSKMKATSRHWIKITLIRILPFLQRQKSIAQLNC